MTDGFADVPDLVKNVANGMQICAFLIIIGILGTGDLIQERGGRSCRIVPETQG